MTPVADAIVGALLLVSGVAVVVSAIGLLRLPDFFVRMHAPSLAYTLGTWTATLAAIINFSAHEGVPSLSAWLVIVLLSITAPVTTVFLARAAIFRRRAAGEDAPPPLGAAVSEPPRQP
jgi:multicomponent K+:H+ antiporter subunit G